MRIRNALTLLAAAIIAAACGDIAPVEPILGDAPDAPSYGKAVPTPTSLWKLPTADAGLGLRSDQRLRDGAYSEDGAYSVYEDGVCGVVGKIFTGTGSGDATIQTNNPRTKDNSCAIRKMSLVYPSGDPVYQTGGIETMPVFVNLRNVSNNTTTIAIGYDNRVERILSVNPSQAQRCDAWRWSNGLSNGVVYNGDNVWVQRLDATTYHVYTKDRDPVPVNRIEGANKATCTTTGQLHNLSVDLHVVSKQPLP